MRPISTIAERLKNYRTSRNLSFNDMERLTGVPAQTLNRYELGQRSPKIDIALNLAEALHVNPMWLQGYDVPEKIPVSSNEDGRCEEFASLFSQLSADHQALIVATIKGLLSQK